MSAQKGKDARLEEESSVELKLVEDANSSFERVLDVLASILIDNAENDGTIAVSVSTPAAQAA